MDLSNYVKPELLVVAVVLCVFGTAVKKTGVISCRYLPFLNAALGIVICSLYVFATAEVSKAADIALAAFTSVTQGILVTGLATVVCRMVGKENNIALENKEKDRIDQKEQDSAVSDNADQQNDMKKS